MLRLGLVPVPGSQDDLRTPGALIGLDSFPGRLAQLGERRLDKAEVIGSSPISPITRISPDRSGNACKITHFRLLLRVGPPRTRADNEEQMIPRLAANLR